MSEHTLLPQLAVVSPFADMCDLTCSRPELSGSLWVGKKLHELRQRSVLVTDKAEPSTLPNFPQRILLPKDLSEEVLACDHS